MTTRTSFEVTVDASLKGADAAFEAGSRAVNRYSDSLSRALSNAAALEKQISDDLTRELKRQEDALKRQHDVMDQAGKGMLIAGGAMAAGLAFATKAAVDWESAWTGVRKTVSGTPAEIAALEKQLRGLATTLPTSHAEIAGIAEAAGQLGIRTKDIAGFTRTVIDLANTTNLTADQAATSMARFANIMQTPQDEIDRLGASLVALGNNGASTEADILEMGMRIAAAGKLIGLSEGEVMGYANALSSLGVEAEAGGTAVSQTFRLIDSQVKGGGSKLEAYARTAGMTVRDFSKAWAEDAPAALQAVLTGLQQVNQSGGDLYGTLDQLGIVGVRQTDTILRLAQSGDLLADSLKLGNEAYAANNALVAEAEKRYATTEAKVKVAFNTLREGAIDVGAVLIPALSAVVGTVADMATAFNDLPGPVKTGAAVLAALAAALALAGGAALVAIPRFAALQTSIAQLESGALKTAGTRLLSIGSILTGPWGAALGVGAVALGLFAAKHGEAAREVDALKETLDEQTGAITENSREWAVKKLSDDGVLANAKKLGLDLGLVTDAALGNTGAISALNGEYDKLIATMPKVSRVVDGKTFSATDTSSAQYLNLQKVRDALGDTNGTLADAREKWDDQRAAMGSSGDAATETAVKQEAVGTAFQESAEAAGTLTDETKSLKDAFDELNGATLTQREAQRAYQAAIDDARASLKDNGKTLDITTEKGRKNAAVLDDVAKASQSQLDAMDKNGASAERINKVYGRQHDQLVALARSFGMSKKEAEAYADRVHQLPTEITTEVAQPGMRKAKSDTDDLQAKIDKLKGQRHELKMGARTEDAERKIKALTARINRLLDQMPDEDIKLTLSASAKNTVAQLRKIYGTNDPGFASGGAVYGPGSGTSDDINARLSNGEHVNTEAEVTKLGGGDNRRGQQRMYALRRMIRRGEFGKLGDVPAFALGGEVNVAPRASMVGAETAVGQIGTTARVLAEAYGRAISQRVNKAVESFTFEGGGSGAPLGFAGGLTPEMVLRGQAFAKAQQGKPYGWGSAGPGSYDCSGYQSAVTNATLGRYPYQRLFSTGTFPSAGFRPGTGIYTIGSFKGNPGHMSGNLAGVNIESSGGVGVRYGGGARSPMSSMFNTRAHLGTHDSGGWLGHGMAGINLSGKPEAVLTHEESRGLQAFAKGGAVKFGSPSGGIGDRARALSPGSSMSITKLLADVARPETVESLKSVNAAFATMRSEARDVAKAEREVAKDRRAARTATKDVRQTERELEKLRDAEKPDKKEIARLERELRAGRKQSKAADKELERSEKDLAGQRDQLSNATDRWKQKQQDLIETWKQASEALTEAALDQAARITDQGAVFGGQGTSVTAEGLLKKLTGAASGGEEFIALTKTLKGKGLNQQVLDQIFAEGSTPEALALARSLTETPEATLRQINAQQARLSKAGKDAGVWAISGGASPVINNNGTTVNLNGPISTTDVNALAREVQKIQNRALLVARR